MKNKTKVLIVTQEMSPYLDLTNIAKIARQLPQHLQQKGMEIRVLMPRFGTINERRHRLHEVVRLSGINVIIDEDDFPLVIKVASLPGARMQVYFLDNEDLFKRKFVFHDGLVCDLNICLGCMNNRTLQIDLKRKRLIVTLATVRDKFTIQLLR